MSDDEIKYFGGATILVCIIILYFIVKQLLELANPASAFLK